MPADVPDAEVLAYARHKRDVGHHTAARLARMGATWDEAQACWVVPEPTQAYSATKYDSAAHEVVAILADEAEGYGKASTGDVESPTGYLQLVHLDETCDLDVQDTTGAYPQGDLAGETARRYGVTADDIRGSWVVTSNSQGFVACERYDTAAGADDAYACAAARYAEWSDEDRDEDADGVYVCPVIGHGYHSL